jgi:tRNA(Ile2) C34 agmatinyltransferase TiaS
MIKPIPGSFAWEAQQLVRAVAAAHQKPEEKDEPPLCPHCEKRPRVYSNGRLYSYCAVCRKAVNKARYEKVKKSK